MIILFKSGQSLALCGAHFIPAYTLNDKTNAVKAHYKFNNIISHVMFKGTSAQNSNEFGSSNFRVLCLLR